MISFAHTYWTKPADDSRYNFDTLRQKTTCLYCYALSATYIKNLGYNIKLYGDKEALELLKDLPYDDFIELNIPETADTRFWAQSKFYALDKMGLWETLIDGDIFIKAQEIVDRIDNDSDVTVQSLETGYMLDSAAYIRCRNYMEGIDFGGIYKPCEKLPICNSGILRISSQEVKDRYIEEYFKAAEVLDKVGKLQDMPLNIHPDILQEQLLLYQLCQFYGYNLSTVFDTSDGPYLKINQDKYVHLISDKKYIMLPLVKKWLRELNPGLYEKLIRIEDKIKSKNKT